jgi:hypothetical protein
VNNSHAFLSQPTDLFGKIERVVKGERVGGGMMRSNIRKGYKTWARRGWDFGRVYLFSCFLL